MTIFYTDPVLSATTNCSHEYYRKSYKKCIQNLGWSTSGKRLSGRSL